MPTRLSNIWERVYAYGMLRFFSCVLFVLSVSLQYVSAQDVHDELTATDFILSSEEQIWISEHPIIRATNEMDWPPIDFVRAGEPTGFAIDYLNLVAEKVGLNIEYVNGYTWNELMELVRVRDIDLAHSLIQTDERSKFLDFTHSYIELTTGYYGRVGADRIEKVEDLKGKRIGFTRGSGVYNLHKAQYPDFEYVEFDSAKDTLVALVGGGIDVALSKIAIADYIISESFIIGIEIIGSAVANGISNEEHHRFGTRKDWPLLVGILEKGMAAVSVEEFHKISDKWQAEYRDRSNVGLTTDELKWLAANKVIKVAFDPAIPPVEFIDENGKMSGVSAAYLEKIEKKLNVRFEWIGNETFQKGVESIENKQADMFSAIAPTAERLKFLTYTDSFLDTSPMIFSRSGGDVIGDMEGLIGKRVAQVAGFSLNEYIKQDYPDLEMVEVSTVADALRLVSAGKVDAHIGSVPITSYNIAAESLTNLAVVGVTPYKSNIAMAIRSELPLLASAMQKALDSITERERAEILRDWLVLKTETTINYKTIWAVVAGAIFIIALIVIWNVGLRREIRRRRVAEEELTFSRMEAEQAKIVAEAAKLEADLANMAKSTFLANMSHEIRTPLNAIIGFSDVMLSGIFGEIKEARYISYLNDIKDSGEHLATVINDILDLSKIEAGKWKLNEEEFSLDSGIDDAMRMLNAQALQKNLTFVKGQGEKGLSLNLYGDPHSIKRAVINIISNAVKFTEDGGQVICSVSQDNNGNAIITVEDSGIGIPADRINQVLIAFEQAEGTHNLNEEGTGLGLPIVKQLVELHGGRFSLKSEMGIGTTATIMLPAERVLVTKYTPIKGPHSA